MHKIFVAKLYFRLIFFLLIIAGCQIAGSGGMFYEPPKNIPCDKPWIIKVEFIVIPIDPKERYGKLSERYKDVTIHIRDSSKENFLAVPMVIERVNPEIGKLSMKAAMKPIPCNSGLEYVEYFIDDMFDCHYNRTKLYKVPVSKD